MVTPTTPAVEECTEGKGRSVDTAGHCCWSGQVWNRTGCVGVPSSCPAGLSQSAAHQSCELVACGGGQARAEDGVHCCWPGQGWSKSRATCIGVPKCPTGFEAQGDSTCVDPSLARMAAQQEAAAQAAEASRVAAAAAAATAEAARVAREGPPGAVKVNFKPKDASDRWSLVSKAKGLVCQMPCTAWVSPGNDLSVQLDAARAEDIQKASLPKDIGYSPGTTVDGTARGPYGSQVGGIILVTLGAGSLVLIAGFAGGAEACVNGDSSCAPLLISGLAGGAALIAIGVIVLKNTSQVATVDFTLAGAQASLGPRFKVHPDFVGLEAPSGARIGLTRDGVGGAF